VHSLRRMLLPHAPAMHALTEANRGLGVPRTDVPRDDDAQRVPLHAAP